MDKDEKKEYNKLRKQIPNANKCQGKPTFENENTTMDNDECKSSLNGTHAKIKIKDMTPEQYKEYKSLKQKEYRRKESNEQSTARRYMKKEATATKRKQETMNETESRRKKEKEAAATTKARDRR